MREHPFWTLVGLVLVGLVALAVRVLTRKQEKGRWVAWDIEAGGLQEVEGELPPWEIVGWVQTRKGVKHRYCTEHVWGRRSSRVWGDARPVRMKGIAELHGWGCEEEGCGVEW